MKVLATIAVLLVVCKDIEGGYPYRPNQYKSYPTYGLYHPYSPYGRGIGKFTSHKVHSFDY